MDNNIENKKNINIKNYIVIILAVIIVLIAGTYAWLSYRSNNTHMVLTIGEINDVQVTLSPYKIVSTISPVSAYTDQTNYSTVTVKNNNASSRMINLYYHINNIPDALKISGFKYTITKSTDNSTYTFVKTDSFSSASSNSDFIIHEDSVNSGTTYYRVYVWLDTNDGGNQASAQGATFDAELLSSIYKYTVTFDPNGGTVDTTSKVVSVGDTYGDLPTPTREGYTFLGWNGKNLLNLRDRVEKEPGGGSGYNNTYTRSNMDGKGIYKGISANNYYVPYKVNSYSIDSLNNNVTINSNEGAYGVGFDIKVKPNTDYFLRASKESDNIRVNYGEFRTDGSYIRFTSLVLLSYHVKTHEEAGYLLWVVTEDQTKQNMTSYNLQIEEGDKATPYEPYYVTSDTIVTERNGEYVLKAIWEPIS